MANFENFCVLDRSIGVRDGLMKGVQQVSYKDC